MTVQINLQVVDCSIAEMFHSVSLLQGEGAAGGKADRYKQ